MKVVHYLQCLPPNNKNIQKGDILKKLHKGVQAVGDTSILHNGKNLIPADVGSSVGWVHENGKTSPHLKFRRNIIDFQKNNNNRVLLADSNLFLYKDTKNPLDYLRYSFDGIFPDTGEYCDGDIDPIRWKKISKNLNLELKDYRKNGNHILICLQRNGGWSMGGLDVIQWLNKTITEIRRFSDRPIVVRGHPGDKGALRYLAPNNLVKSLINPKNVTVSKPGAGFNEDLKRCWAVVNHNSSPAVGAAIEGYPVFLTDPEKSQAKDIANIDLSKIEQPILFDRQTWVERLCMFHWSFEEIEAGEAWHHMRKFV